VENLPEAIREHDFTREQTLLAQSQLGNHHLAIAGLLELNDRRGETPERCGLIGGRYKRLWRTERDKRKEKGDPEPGLQEEADLDSAIENYRRGMNLDLNEYYCVCNLPGLLRSRGGPGDEEEAAFLDRLTVLATERKINRGEDDGWARSTLLGAAFRVADVAKVAGLAREVVREGPALWQLDSTLKDINDTIVAMPESEIKRKLTATRDQLARLMK
jgi:hypothetical protein